MHPFQEHPCVSNIPSRQRDGPFDPAVVVPQQFESWQSRENEFYCGLSNLVVQQGIW